MKKREPSSGPREVDGTAAKGETRWWAGGRARDSEEVSTTVAEGGGEEGKRGKGGGGIKSQRPTR